MILNRISWAETDGRIAESADQDQTARMCSLILIYTLRQNNSMVASGKIGVNFFILTHSHTMTPFDAPGKQAF